MPLLPIFFFVTALVYASIGFGGGSTYNALLVLGGEDYRHIPAIALICNIIVVSGGAWRFSADGHTRLSRLWPWLMASIPAAWLGGRLEVSESVFTGLLGASLLFAGIRLLSNRRQSEVASVNHPKGPLFFAFGAGGLLGLLSGIVGIGGGIFLAPILYFLNWGRPKEIAAACSLFILVNSLAGLLGQSTKLAASDDIPTLLQHWPLFIAVLIGGQIGARLGASRIPPGFIQTLTGILIVYVALRLLYRFAALL